MILSLIKEYLPLLILGFNVAMFVVIKFNDMKHIEESLKKLIEKVEGLEKTLTSHSERIANIEGRCSANHS